VYSSTMRLSTFSIPLRHDPEHHVPDPPSLTTFHPKPSIKKPLHYKNNVLQNHRRNLTVTIVKNALVLTLPI
jgi:hypothetical protein